MRGLDCGSVACDAFHSPDDIITSRNVIAVGDVINICGVTNICNVITICDVIPLWAALVTVVVVMMMAWARVEGNIGTIRKGTVKTRVCILLCTYFRRFDITACISIVHHVKITHLV
jgi:hypothetical protein